PSERLLPNTLREVTPMRYTSGHDLGSRRERCQIHSTWTGVVGMIAHLNEDVNSIGNVAGQIWNYLNDQGAVTMTQLTRDVDAPRDAVMQGVGWLAREGKVTITKDARVRRICLTENGCH
ncbi:MAG: winged helix-turn-helix domain-containing protein, partial [Planctomycetaceae bacterium]|nr:winged helix-turn-helix domain-containing protein [Planctomycetaceae bacterium]